MSSILTAFFYHAIDAIEGILSLGRETATKLEVRSHYWKTGFVTEVVATLKEIVSRIASSNTQVKSLHD